MKCVNLHEVSKLFSGKTKKIKAKFPCKFLPCQTPISGKHTKKIIINLSSAEFAKRMITRIVQTGFAADKIHKNYFHMG